MKIIDYVKQCYSKEIDKKEMEKVLRKAGKNLILEINRQANGSKEQVAFIIGLIKNFFGGLK